MASGVGLIVEGELEIFADIFKIELSLITARRGFHGFHNAGTSAREDLLQDYFRGFLIDPEFPPKEGQVPVARGTPQVVIEAHEPAPVTFHRAPPMDPEVLKPIEPRLA